MNILSIGNSFSQDATRYVHSIARADGVELNTCNLYIGGCTLETHYNNMLSGESIYALEYNGHQTGFFISLKEALQNRPWDVITLQQASQLSFRKDSYFPYIKELYNYVKSLCPDAKIIIHQTWMYEEGSTMLTKFAGLKTSAEMFCGLKHAYSAVAEEIGADGIIPSGETLWYLVKRGIKIHRDTFHASLGLGRYALGLLWYRLLTGNSVASNNFCDFDEFIPREQIELAKAYIDSVNPIFKQ